MIRYFLKTTFRSFKKFNRNFLINILGLSTSFVCLILVALWVKDEQSVDNFHENESDIYQVMFNYKNGNETYTFEWTPAPLANALVDQIPQVEYATNVYSFANQGIILNEKNVSIRTNEIYAGKDFFTMFSFNLLAGKKENVINDVNSVVLSDKLAESIFGDVDSAIGKTIDFKQQELTGLYKVSGVFESVPNNSTLHFDAVFSFDNLLGKLPEMNTWEANEPFTFVLLNSSEEIATIHTKFTELLAKNSPAQNLPSVFTRPFSDKYLYNNYENGVQSGGRITYINLFSTIAMLILLIAIVNFVNLSTAQGANRGKEIGVKRVLGIERKGLVLQFLGESIIISFLALFIAIGFVSIILPEFNVLVEKSIILNFEVSTLFYVFIITCGIGILSGIYPALYLSGFKTIKLLKGNVTAKNSEKNIRKSLVVFQFATSVFLIIAVIVTTNQINHVNNKALGYNTDQVVVFKKDGKLKNNLDVFLSEVKTIPGVVNVSSASLSHLTNNSMSTKNVVWNGKSLSNDVSFKYILANYDFIELLNIEMKSGRSFSKSFSTEKDKIIINETAANEMGFKNPIGETVTIARRDYQIIGIAKDFHFQSLYEKVQPLFMKISDRGDEVMIKIAAGSVGETLTKIKEYHKSFNYGLSLDYRFLDSDYQKLYEAETRVTILSKYFGAIAIILSCLGLFGLVTFSIGKRYREIGVRKVLGASIMNIVLLVSKEFFKLVFIAIVVAIPVSWFVMDNWLQGFAYRIEIDLWVFVLSGFIAILIAFTTIGFQTIKAAIANPIKSLRTE